MSGYQIEVRKRGGGAGFIKKASTMQRFCSSSPANQCLLQDFLQESTEDEIDDVVEDEDREDFDGKTGKKIFSTSF